MSNKDKSHREPSRKRGVAGTRFGVLLVAVIGILAASWLAPGAERAKAVVAAPPSRLVTQPAPAPSSATITEAADVATAAALRPFPPHPRRRPVDRRAARRRGSG